MGSINDGQGQGATPTQSGDGTAYSLRRIFALVNRLVRRPSLREALGWGSGGRPARRRRGIPMVCLVREPAQADVLEWLQEHVENARPKRVPYAFYSFEPGTPNDPPGSFDDLLKPVTRSQVFDVAEVLRAIVDQLADGPMSIDGRFRFWRFHLVYWLMTRKPVKPSRDPRSAINAEIRRHDLVTRRNNSLADTGAKVAGSFWPNLVLKVVPPFWYLLRRSGSISFIGREYYWLIHQPFLAPDDPGTVLGFAGRIRSALHEPQQAKSARPREDPEQLLYLLVNAFLEDLRRIYHRSFWRPRNSRRTTYPVVLIDNIRRRNGGYLLLRAINNVRNETGAFDPAVFISGSRRIPPLALNMNADNKHGRRMVGMNDTLDGYDDWETEFRDRSRMREPTSWFLPIKISEQWASAGTVVPELRKPWPPLRSRASVLLLAALLIIGGIFWGSATVVNNHCGTYPLLDSYFDTQYRLTDESTSAQCIGITDQGFPPITETGNDPNTAQFSQVQNAILAQNEEVSQRHADTPDHPYLTLIYLTAFSMNPSTLSSEKESLMGVAASQREQLDSPQGPLIRILFANGGDNMQESHRVADMIRTLVHKDPSIVGVIGITESRTQTAEAIKEVGDAGVPVMASNLSANELPLKSSLYFQVDPQNSREADLVGRYLRKISGLGTGGEIQLVHSTDESDIYSRSLFEDSTKTFEGNGFKVIPLAYSPDGTNAPNMQQLSEQLCDVPKNEAIFFTGRPTDFANLVDRVKKCPDGSPQLLIADDDVSRYAADNNQIRDAGVPFTYVSFGIGTRDCTGDDPMNTNLRKIFPQNCLALLNPSLDGHAGLSYDAMSVFASSVLSGNPSPTAVQLIAQFYNTDINGVSGIINFRDSTKRGVPANKFLAMMQSETTRPGNGVHIIAYCGQPPAGTRLDAADLHCE